ncbi:MAG: DUF4126 family protein [Hymenobacteraceae bacterium]|nr:DUF4126 family protein [Hymenobacteraceae bacterium]
MRTPKYIWQAVALGALAGMRSMAAPALLSHYLSKHPSSNLNGTPMRFMQYPQVSTATKIMAASEMTGDKMPGIPDRISPAALAGRTASGALVAATLFKAHQDRMVTGALIGATAAVAATFGSFYLRKALAQNTMVKDSVLGMLEDFLVIRSGLQVMKE